MLSQIKPLTQEQRQKAYESSQQAVAHAVGKQPQRDNFDRHTASRYPSTVSKLINGLCIILLLAAFTPSAKAGLIEERRMDRAEWFVAVEYATDSY
jgi:hypothetical protein